MNKYWLTLGLLFSILQLKAQMDNDSIESNYLEDQLYLSLTYNILQDKPSQIAQNGFSGGISTGFIRDIPFNKSRTIGVGIGLGYAFNAYIQNLKISKINDIIFFEPAINFNTNRFTIHSIELPLEFRWRNSTATKYKFWRIYGGLKASYVFMSKTKYSDELETITLKNIPEFEKIQYGFMLSAGYSTWNLYVYYGINNLFKNSQLMNEKVNLKDINIGLKFYIM